MVRHRKTTFKKADADAGKPRFSLLPLDAIMHVVAVMEFGAAKYGAGNWRKCEGQTRYFDAAMRHLVAWWTATSDAEKRDGETGASHLAHAVCCLLFLLAFEVRARSTATLTPPAATTPADTSPAPC